MPINPDATNPVAVLVTDRLELSFGHPADASVLFSHVHGEAGRAITDSLYWDGPERAEELVAYFARHATGTFEESGFHWLLRDRTGSLTGKPGTPLGSIGIRASAEADVLQVGYWLAADHWQKGLMSEALAAVIELAFELWDYREIEAEVFDRNVAGVRLVESLGFRLSQRMPEAVVKRGEAIDESIYRLARDDWRSV